MVNTLFDSGFLYDLDTKEKKKKLPAELLLNTIHMPNNYDRKTLYKTNRPFKAEECKLKVFSL